MSELVEEMIFPRI